MPEYLYVVKQPDGAWTLATRAGHLTTVAESDLPADAPRLVAHPRSTIPTMPLYAPDGCACCNALARDHQEALEAELAGGGKA